MFDFERDKANGDLDLLEGWRAQSREDRRYAHRVWVLLTLAVGAFWSGVYVLFYGWPW